MTKKLQTTRQDRHHADLVCFYVAFVFLWVLLAVACEADVSLSGQAGDTCTRSLDCQSDLNCVEGTCQNRPPLAPFGASCVDNTGCESDLCVMAGGIRYCSLPCESTQTCLALSEQSCCDPINQMCLLPTQCVPTADGDAFTDSDSDLDSPCETDSYTCDENRVLRCSESGSWLFYKTCNGGTVCDAGNCVAPLTDGDMGEQDEPLCSPNKRRCVGEYLEFCTSQGKWHFFMNCPPGDECVEGECRIPLGGPCESSEDCDPPDQYCLLEHDNEETGTCAVFCDMEGGHCLRGTSCVERQCKPIEGYCTSDSQCDLDSFCNRRPGGDEGLCLRYCMHSEQTCPPSYTCEETAGNPNYGRCVPGDDFCEDTCELDEDCHRIGHHCNRPVGQDWGCCIPYCTSHDDCAAPLICRPDGRCGVSEGECDCDHSCPPSWTCDPIYCYCVQLCPPCPEGECCDERSFPNCYPCNECVNPPICFSMTLCCPGYTCTAVVYGVFGFCM